MKIKALILTLLLVSPFAHGWGTGYSDVLGHVTVNGPYGPKALAAQKSGLSEDDFVTVIIHVSDEEAAKDLASVLNSMTSKDEKLGPSDSNKNLPKDKDSNKSDSDDTWHATYNADSKKWEVSDGTQTLEFNRKKIAFKAAEALNDAEGTSEFWDDGSIECADPTIDC